MASLWVLLYRVLKGVMVVLQGCLFFLKRTQLDVGYDYLIINYISVL